MDERTAARMEICCICCVIFVAHIKVRGESSVFVSRDEERTRSGVCILTD